MGRITLNRTAHLKARVPVVLETRVVAGSGGGPDKTILNSPRFLDAHGYRTVCAYLRPPDDPGFEQLRQKAIRWQAPLVEISDRGPFDRRVFSDTLQLCRDEKVAIWHGHDYKTNLLGILLRPFWPMRLVTTVHGWVEFTARTAVYFTVDRFCLPFYEKVFCVSPDLYNRTLRCGVRRRDCILLENGIDTEEFSRRNSVLASKTNLRLSGDQLMIGAVGRLSPEKGFDLLIRAVDALARCGIPVHLMIVGEGNQKAALEQLTVELGCRDRVHWMGFQSDVRPFYEAMDVYALSSLREGLPNVILEAMAYEVPVVATRIAGVPRVIEDGVNGSLIPPGNVEALTAALHRLLTDETERVRLARQGRRTIEERYSFRRRMDKVATVFNDLLGRPT